MTTQSEYVADGLERVWDAVLAFVLTGLILFGVTAAWTWTGLVHLPKRPSVSERL